MLDKPHRHHRFAQHPNAKTLTRSRPFAVVSFARWCPLLSFTASIIVFFLLTVASILLVRAAVAGVSATMMVAMLILRMIPELEIFELFGQKAQLRKRIDEADEIFANLRKLATAISKPVAKTTAWSNWLGGMSWEEKLLLEDDTTWFELTEWIELHKGATRKKLISSTPILSTVLSDKFEPVSGGPVKLSFIPYQVRATR